jgi:replicative superfamily II helicase
MQLPYIPRNEEPAVAAFMDTLRTVWGKGPYLKASTLATDLHDWLSAGKSSPQIRPITMDAERITGAIQWISGLKHLNRPEMLKILPIRIRYGVSAELCDLVQIKGVGAIKARKLAGYGVVTFEDVLKNPKKVASVMGEKNVDRIMAEVKVLMRATQECE